MFRSLQKVHIQTSISLTRVVVSIELQTLFMTFYDTFCLVWCTCFITLKIMTI